MNRTHTDEYESEAGTVFADGFSEEDAGSISKYELGMRKS
jgi:hypothetical protein